MLLSLEAVYPQTPVGLPAGKSPRAMTAAYQDGAVTLLASSVRDHPFFAGCYVIYRLGCLVGLRRTYKLVKPSKQALKIPTRISCKVTVDFQTCTLRGTSYFQARNMAQVSV